MSTVALRRSNVTIEEISAVLRDKLDSKYKVTCSSTNSGSRDETADNEDAIFVKGNALMRATIRIVPGANGREIRVSPGGVVWGRLINAIGIARMIRHVLQQAPELDASK